MKTLNSNFNSKIPYIKIFALGFITAFCLFVPFLVVDKGFFLYAGDFNSQQIPFYMNAVRAVQEGSFNWSWNTDLGGSMVNCYSFYLVGSPFFWLSCLFPYKWVPYMMPLWLMLKFAVASLGAFMFLRRYAKDANFAYIGALLYAFSGFAVYNIFFNHFLESVAFFPFLLWSLDEFVLNRRRGPFVFFVALNLINNYFFFAGQVVFLFIYFICKVVTKEYIIRAKEFILLAFESLLGVLCGSVLFVPSAASILQNPRSTQMFEGMEFWLYKKVQQYFAIFMSAFYPPEIPYSPNLFTDCTVKWTSMSAFVALGGMFGFFVFLKYFRKSAFTKIFVCCAVFAFVPILNSSFYAFNDNYYARWFYMPLLILAAMNMHSFTLCKGKIFHGLKCTAVCTAVFCIFALTPSKTEEGAFKLGLQKDTALFWLMFLIAAVSLYLCFVLVQNFRSDKMYAQKILRGVLAAIMFFSIPHMALVKIPQMDNEKNYIPQNYTAIDTFDLADEGKDFRLDAYQCYNNVGLFIDKPVIHFFNSTVTPSIMEFYPFVNVTRDVSSKPDQSDFALRSLLSVKYVIMPTHEYDNFRKDGHMDIYSEYTVSEPYRVLKNDYFIPFGFTYDYYITAQQIENLSKASRSRIMLRALLVDEGVIENLDVNLEQIDDNALRNLSFESFSLDVEERKSESSSYFEMTGDGFVSDITLTKPNLVFYSVPYDEGFTAYVNGTESEIYKVNSGLCAVYAPAGENEIVFTYRTPYLNTGIILSLIGLGIYISYIILILKKKVKI